MRTKTLLLTAALGVAGVASSMAQGTVFSVNAVGYVNTTVPKGFSLIANPLNNTTDNSIAGLFKNGIQGTIPPGFAIYKFTGTGFAFTSWNDFDLEFQPTSVAAQTVVPGEGVFVKNPNAAPVTITFVGEVMQGSLKNAYPKGLSIRSSQVPQAGTIEALGFKPAENDQLYTYNSATQQYALNTYSFGAWEKALTTLNVGDAVFIKAFVGGSWDRTFTVNQ